MDVRQVEETGPHTGAPEVGAQVLLRWGRWARPHPLQVLYVGGVAEGQRPETREATTFILVSLVSGVSVEGFLEAAALGLQGHQGDAE